MAKLVKNANTTNPRKDNILRWQDFYTTYIENYRTPTFLIHSY